jgi:hypothetical protein
VTSLGVATRFKRDGVAAIDHPEHALGGGVGLLDHHSVDEPVEGARCLPGLGAAEQLGALEVLGAPGR